MSQAHLKTSSEVGVKDRSLPMSQGVIESGGSPLLHREFSSEYHAPSQYPEIPETVEPEARPEIDLIPVLIEPEDGHIAEGPQAENGSAYKVAGPVIARVHGSEVMKSRDGLQPATAGLKRGHVTQAQKDGCITHSDHQRLHGHNPEKSTLAKPSEQFQTAPESSGATMPVTAKVSQGRISLGVRDTPPSATFRR
jgi:hypothetical protein